MNSNVPIKLTVACDPSYARLVRMTAANVATLSSMSVERVEDIRMAAEEAFIYACATNGAHELEVSFNVDASHVCMTFTLDVEAFSEPSEDDPTAVYVDLILGSVCDTYQKLSGPAVLVLEVKADL